MAANGLVSPIAALIQKGAFALTAILLSKSGGDFTLPYTVFIGSDILAGHGNALLSLLFWVTNPLLSGRSGVRVTSRTLVNREQC